MYRKLQLLLVVPLAAAGLLAVAPVASAAPAAVSVAGQATPDRLVAPGTVTFKYAITVTGADATGVVLTTGQATQLPADVASIRVDGAPVPPATVTAAAPNFTLRAGSGADATGGGTLAVGAHTLTFATALSSAEPARATSTLTVATDESTADATVAVAVNQPDLALALPPGSGEDRPAPVGTGVTGSFVAELRNLGAPAAARLTVVLPTGLVLDSDGVFRYPNRAGYEDGTGSPLKCAGTGGTITCELGVVAVTGPTADPPLIEVNLRATAAGVPGTSATFSLSVAPTTGVDTDPSNDTVRGTVTFAATAALTGAITPGTPKVTVGQSLRLTLSVTNHGPQAAPQTVGIAILDGSGHFSITGFDGPTTPPDGGAPSAGTSGRVAAPGSALTAEASSDDTDGDTGTDEEDAEGDHVLWFVDTVPAGATVTAHLTVTARSVGSAQLALLTGSAAADPNCATESDPCTPALATLTAVAAPATHHSAPTTHHAAPVSPPGIARPAGTTPKSDPPLQLAKTGSANARLAMIGAALLVAGGLLTAAARPRRRRS